MCTANPHVGQPIKTILSWQPCLSVLRSRLLNANIYLCILTADHTHTHSVRCVTFHNCILLNIQSVYNIANNYYGITILSFLIIFKHHFLLHFQLYVYAHTYTYQILFIIHSYKKCEHILANNCNNNSNIHRTYVATYTCENTYTHMYCK